MATLLYAVTKLLAYSAWCHVGLRWARPDAASARTSFGLGAVRWMIGLGFGVLIFLASGSLDPDEVTRTYFLVYTPVRALEWGIMAFIIAAPSHRESGSRWVGTARLPLWCIGGILVSFLTDLLSPEGLEGRFCMGRCLC